MFYDSRAFRTMEAGVSAAWLQQKVHTHNLSNYDTPNYKAKSLVFSESLSRARDAEGKRRPALSIRLIDNETTTVRPDGNNVDSDVESLSLYKAYVHYSMLLDKIKSEVNNHNYVLSNAPK
ncbi:MAG: flagellar basal body rod protein FlgB [Clostridiales bacterium]|nr:flagellar basal body rod protein FlgB [Clostridiales bacterium]